MIIESTMILIICVIEGWAIALYLQTKGQAKTLQDAERQLSKAKRIYTGQDPNYRELIYNSNSIIVCMNAKGYITCMNEFAQNFFGYTEEEIIGENALGTIIPLKNNEENLIEKITNNPKQYMYYTDESQKKNGEKVWIAWTNKIIQNKAGQITEIISIGYDITKRKALEEEFKQMTIQE